MMKTCIKRIVCILSAAILIIGLSPALAAGFDQATLDGIVMVLTRVPNSDGDMDTGWGTGFFVGAENEDPQYLLTNCHVVADFILSGGGNGYGTLQVVFDKQTFEEAYIVDYDGEKDIAILKLAKPTDKRKPLKFIEPDTSLVGNQVYAIGYPLAAEVTVSSVEFFSQYDATVTSGSISRLMTKSGTGVQLIQTDVSISGGNSGGPLVDTNGAVLGINTLGSTLDPNMFYAVSISEAIPMLRNNGISFEPYRSNNNMLYIYIGAGAAALVIIAVLVVVLIRKNKKKEIPSGEASAPQPVPAAPKAMPFLRSTSVQHNGMTVNLTGQPVLIGRDVSSCRIVFKEGTPGVSSKHCQLYYNESEDVFILTDLTSTYGTYLASGQKLTPNVPYTLRRRDSFYLGEQENSLYVDMG